MRINGYSKGNIAGVNRAVLSEYYSFDNSRGDLNEMSNFADVGRKKILPVQVCEQCWGSFEPTHSSNRTYCSQECKKNKRTWQKLRMTWILILPQGVAVRILKFVSWCCEETVSNASIVVGL